MGCGGGGVWGSKKATPANFFHLTSPNLGIGKENLPTFSFNHFAILVSNSSSYLVSVPNCQSQVSVPNKLEIMITTLIEMLQLPNLGRVTTTTI